MQSRTITSGGIDLHTESFGKSADPAMVLIMGAAASGVWWPEDFCEELAGRGRYSKRGKRR
jgi:hypothetical protein